MNLLLLAFPIFLRNVQTCKYPLEHWFSIIEYLMLANMQVYTWKSFTCVVVGWSNSTSVSSRDVSLFGFELFFLLFGCGVGGLASLSCWFSWLWVWRMLKWEIVQDCNRAQIEGLILGEASLNIYRLWHKQGASRFILWCLGIVLFDNPGEVC